MKNKTHWKKAFNKDYLGACDLDDKDLVAVIDHVEVKPIKDTSGGEENRNVAIFKGKIKPMVLNVTNCKIVRKFTGSSFIEDWKDVAVQIYIEEVKAFGEMTDGLRIRKKQPVIEKPKLTPSHEKWSGAVDYLKKGNTIDGILKHWQLSEKDRETLLNAAL
jgi:hypothetical protein